MHKWINIRTIHIVLFIIVFMLEIAQTVNKCKATTDRLFMIRKPPSSDLLALLECYN